ncbi:hypothetical protein MHBO_001790 [Bonamia ostreae]|uniref:Palmitoyltransferase n=1 Tax=Bonamia ostreae TaxID=126728 RepID=A0ABV2AKA5_9EUKA
MTTFGTTWMATSMNVADEHLLKRGFPDPFSEFNLSSFELEHRRDQIESNKTKWCDYCRWNVGLDTKHCRECDRCTEHFDHHCKWLNNCVSRKNYKWFCTSAISALLMLLFSFGTSIFGFVVSFTSKDEWENLLGMSLLTYQILVFVNMVMTLVLMTSLIYLLSFHIFLSTKRMTTYEYILSQRCIFIF